MKTIKLSMMGGRQATMEYMDGVECGDLTLRDYQLDNLEYLEAADRDGVNTTNVMPTGSGKTLAILAYAARRLNAGNTSIIIVPKLGIATGFQRYTNGREARIFKEVNKRARRKQIRRIRAKRARLEIARLDPGRVYQPEIDKAASILNELANPWPGIIVASYAAFAGALKACKAGNKVAKLFSNVVAIIDEAHHSSLSSEDAKYANQLGRIIKKCCRDLKMPVHAFTATDFRSDGSPLIDPSYGFETYKRTLLEHYQDGWCPDFGLYFEFYHKVNKHDFDILNQGDNGNVAVKIGSSEALIEAYVRAFRANMAQTLMHVPAIIKWTKADKDKLTSAALSKRLYDRLSAEFPWAKILNLGSDDGKTLISDRKSVAKERYERLQSGEYFDIVISIKVMTEGMDWQDCAQTFSPRVPASLLTLIQQSIGRALRMKRKGHRSPRYSKIVLFEVGIDSEDAVEVAGALFDICNRLAAFCSNPNFTTPYRFDLPRKAAKAVSEERDAIESINSGVADRILRKVGKLVAQQYSVAELVKSCHKLMQEEGLRASKLTAMEFLVRSHVVNGRALKRVSSAISKAHCRRLGNAPMDELMEDPKFVKLVNQLKTHGAAEFIKILSGKGAREAKRALYGYIARDVEKRKHVVLKLISMGESKPSVYDRRLCSGGPYTYRQLALTISDCKHGGAISRHLPFLQAVDEAWPNVDTISEKKEILLQMFRNGELRPTFDDHPHPKYPQYTYKQLALAYQQFTCPSRWCYDSDFVASVTGWKIITDHDRKKRIVEQMARSGHIMPSVDDHRPVTGHPEFTYAQLAGVLYRCTQRGGPCFDAEFTDVVSKFWPIRDKYISTYNMLIQFMHLRAAGITRAKAEEKLGRTLKAIAASLRCSLKKTKGHQMACAAFNELRELDWQSGNGLWYPQLHVKAK